MIRIFNQYVSIKSIVLVVAETLVVALCLICAATLRFWNDPSEFDAYVRLPGFAVQVFTVIAALQICFYYNDLYNLHAMRSRNELLITIGQSLGEACVLLGLIYFALPQLLIGRGVFFISMGLVSTLVFGIRVFVESAWPVAAPIQKILIIGAGELAATVSRELTSRQDLNVTVTGFFVADGDADTGVLRKTCYGEALACGVELQSVVREYGISRIIVALEERRQALPIRNLVRLRVEGLAVEDAQTVISALTGRVWLNTVHPSWFVFTDGFRRSRLMLAIKRVVDVSCATAGLMISLPLMGLIGLIVRLDSKGPIIYRQRRVGLHGRCFEVLKFRSMRVNAEAHNGAQWAQANDPRVTRVGKYLRKFRLDEFPQFVNVIRGDMSFVGPRPERPEFVEQLRKIIPYYDDRHSVRPGLTGWAQVQYKYGSTVDDACRKLEYDLFYLKNMSVTFDVAIIFYTVRTILSGHGGR